MSTSSPKIIISETDFSRLSGLAEATAKSNSSVADYLLLELDRATIKPDRLVKQNTIKMGSTLTYENEHGERRTVTLGFPIDADISRGRISILTPIGAALIGLSVGQSIIWRSLNGDKHRLTVIATSTGPEPSSQAAAE